MTDSPPNELLIDAENLASLFDHLEKKLPQEVGLDSSLERHLYFMKKRLGEEKPELCQQDIEDICSDDITKLEKSFRDWCGSSIHYDQELRDKISELLLQREYDSAIRKAFVILKSRLVDKFGVSRNLDGNDLVNQIFGKLGAAADTLNASERQAMRDLLAGLYGVFRNKYGHQDVEAPWHEADAILSMVNFVLKEIDRYQIS